MQRIAFSADKAEGLLRGEQTLACVPLMRSGEPSPYGAAGEAWEPVFISADGACFPIADDDGPLRLENIKVWQGRLWDISEKNARQMGLSVVRRKWGRMYVVDGCEFAYASAAVFYEWSRRFPDGPYCFNENPWVWFCRFARI